MSFKWHCYRQIVVFEMDCKRCEVLSRANSGYEKRIAELEELEHVTRMRNRTLRRVLVDMLREADVLKARLEKEDG